MSDVYLDAIEDEILDDELEDDYVPQLSDKPPNNDQHNDNFINLHCHSYYSLQN